MEIPKWLKPFLNRSDLDLISEALKKAEASTRGEIVPMVVHRSIPIGHVSTILILLVICFLLMGELVAHVFFSQLFAPVYAVVTALVLLALVPFLSRNRWLQRRLTRSREISHLVEARALFEFYRNGVQATRKSTGVLIFLSLTEHRAVILADQSISEKINNSHWQKIITELVAHAKQKKLGRALCHAVEEVGKVLATHFPSDGQPLNELKNQLLIRE